MCEYVQQRVEEPCVKTQQEVMRVSKISRSGSLSRWEDLTGSQILRSGKGPHSRNKVEIHIYTYLPTEKEGKVHHRQRLM